MGLAMEAKVIPMKPNKPANAPKVTPPVGWLPHSAYGALRDPSGKSLERLEVIHAFLMERDGLSSSDAAIKVFGPFTSDANLDLARWKGADKLRSFLMMCDRADKAYALFPVGKYAVRTHLEKLVEHVPYVLHHRFDRGTPEGLLHSLGSIAGEVWSPVCGAFDLNDRPLAAVADGRFPPVEKARDILGPLAVRHDLAHQLWGWGTVSAAVVDANAAGASPAKKLKRHELAPEWTGEKLKQRKAVLEKQCKEQGVRNYSELLAEETGLPVREISERIKHYNASKSDPMGNIAAQLKKSA